MPWGSLPPEIRAKIFSFLTFRERASMALVCRAWRDSIFNGPLSRDYILKISGSADRDVLRTSLLEAGNRCYRNVSVCWVLPAKMQNENLFFNELNKTLKKLTDDGTVRYLKLAAPLDRRLLRFFEQHAQLLDSLEELYAELSAASAKERCLKGVQVEISLSNLKILSWKLNTYEGNLKVVLNVPNAVKVKTKRVVEGETTILASENRKLVEIRNGDNIERLTMESVRGDTGRSYFQQQRPNLQRLTLNNPLQPEDRKELEEVVRKLPNLKQLKIYFEVSTYNLLPVFNSLTSLTELRINISDFNLTELFTDLNLFTNLHTLSITSTPCYVDNVCCLHLPALKKFESCYMYPADYSKRIILNLPNIEVLQLSSMDKSHEYFLLVKTDYLHLRELMLRTAPEVLDFFRDQPFPSLEQLDLNVDQIYTKLVHHWDGRFSKLKKLTLWFCEEDEWEDKIDRKFKVTRKATDQLLTKVFNHCRELQEFDFMNFEVSFETLSGLTKLVNLRKLTLSDGEIVGPVDVQLRLENLKYLCVGNVKVRKDQLDSFCVRTTRHIERDVKGDCSIYNIYRKLVVHDSIEDELSRCTLDDSYDSSFE